MTVHVIYLAPFFIGFGTLLVTCVLLSRSWRKKRLHYESEIARQAKDLADQRKAIKFYEETERWVEEREMHFQGIFAALWAITEALDPKKIREIEALGIKNQFGEWVPSRQGVKAMQMHLDSYRELQRAGQLALVGLAEFEEKTPPPRRLSS